MLRHTQQPKYQVPPIRWCAALWDKTTYPDVLINIGEFFSVQYWRDWCENWKEMSWCSILRRTNHKLFTFVDLTLLLQLGSWYIITLLNSKFTGEITFIAELSQLCDRLAILLKEKVNFYQLKWRKHSLISDFKTFS